MHPSQNAASGQETSLRGKRIIVYDPQIILKEMDADSGSAILSLNRIKTLLDKAPGAEIEQMITGAEQSLNLGNMMMSIFDSLIPGAKLKPQADQAMADTDQPLKLDEKETALIKMLRQSPEITESLNLVYRIASFETTEPNGEEEKFALYQLYNLLQILDGQFSRVESVL